MKHKLCFIFLLLFVTYSSAFPQAITYVKNCRYKGYIFSKEHAIWGFPPETTRYTLNKKEVAQAENLLRGKIDEYVVSHQVYA